MIINIWEINCQFLIQRMIKVGLQLILKYWVVTSDGTQQQVIRKFYIFSRTLRTIAKFTHNTHKESITLRTELYYLSQHFIMTFAIRQWILLSSLYALNLPYLLQEVHEVLIFLRIILFSTFYSVKLYATHLIFMILI